LDNADESYLDERGFGMQRYRRFAPGADDDWD
jgi:hypothetical protein